MDLPIEIIEIENDWGLVHRCDFATLSAHGGCPVISSKMWEQPLERVFMRVKVPYGVTVAQQILNLLV